MASRKDNKGRKLNDGESQLKDGRYRYRYTDIMGKRKTLYSWRLTEKDPIPKDKPKDKSLREKISDLMYDMHDSIYNTMPYTTVNELIERYLNTKVTIKDTTLMNYWNMYNCHIKDTVIGQSKIEDVKKSHIKQLYAYFYKQLEFKPSTIQLYQNFLYPAFEMAVDDEVIRLNPCKGAMKEYPRGSLGTTKEPLTREEQRELLEWLPTSSNYSQYYAFMAFMLGTGCRISEAIGMTWNEIHLDEKYVEVKHQVIYKKLPNNPSTYIKHPPKTGETRQIPITNKLVSILNKWKKETYFISLASGNQVEDLEHFVFINRDGGLRRSETFNRAIKGMIAEHNRENEFQLPDFSAHILRHTYCTRMAESGMDVKVLQSLMGHKTIAVTMQVYNHADFERNQKAVDNLDAVGYAVI